MIIVQRRLHRVCARQSAPRAALEALVDHAADVEQLLALESYAKTTAPYEGAFAAEIMAPFAWPTPSRFSDGSYGVLYSAEALDTALLERRFHTARWLAASHAQPTLVPVVALRLRYAGDTHDATRVSKTLAAALYDPDPSRYAVAQHYGSQVRARGAAALRYRSVRHEAGTCFGVFHPAAVHAAELEGEYRYEWDGKTIADMLQRKER